MSNLKTVVRKSTDEYIGMLQQILDNQEAQREAFEEFKEEILEKLDNLSTPGGDYRVIDELGR